MSPRALVVVRWLPFVLLCMAISTVSHLSEPPLQDLLEVRFMDKVLHACAYAGVGVTAYFGSSGMFGATRRALLVAVLLAFTHGALDEVHQSFVPKRYASALDALADLVGATVGASAAAWLTPAFVRRRASDPGAPDRAA